MLTWGLIPGHAGRTQRLINGANEDQGSSPATRGGRKWLTENLIPAGLIPGYAGRTSTAGPLTRRCAAHPRLRGEDQPQHQFGRMPRGSSSATRGGHVRAVHHGRETGLIPGYAGRTVSARPHTRTPWAHPRLRGEDAWDNRWYLHPSGSSPATRGGLLDDAQELVHSGLIPGYAGRTGGGRTSAPSSRAHPRLRGEDRDHLNPAMIRWGSSPATRGGHAVGVEGAASRGSSPATRGGRRLRDRHQRGRGLIPGYAGRTRRPPGRGQPWRAHPRLRGEDTGYRPPERALVGSSPVTRGGPRCPLPTCKEKRLIPGYAGRTGQSIS